MGASDIVITNNPLVRDKLRNKRYGQRLEFHDTDYLGILKAVRDKIHSGHALLTHPLSGSVKPGETPYKTIIVTAEKGALDARGLFLIEESIQTCVKLSVAKKEWSGEILADFQLIDYSLISG